MTFTQTFAALERELNKSKTDGQTYNLVKKIMSDTREWPNELLCQMLDRVELLKSRMEREHGWI